MFLALLEQYAPEVGQTIGGATLNALLRKRAEAARAILLDRLSKGKANISDIPGEEAAAILFRYMRAAEEGAARTNLKLLADVAIGQDAKPGFYANEFLYWAEILASLRREEIIVLGLVHREAQKVGYKIERSGAFWIECVKFLEAERGISPATADTIAAALLRSGLLSLLGGLYDMGHAYLPSSNLEKLGEMANLEAYYMDEPHIPAG